MAKRYSGTLKIRVSYEPGMDGFDYDARVSDGSEHYRCRIGAPKVGFGPGVAYDSPEAYDQIARSAIAFAVNDTDMGDSAEYNEDFSEYEVRRSLNPPKKKSLYVQADKGAGSTKLGVNELWNIPDAPINEVRFDIETLGPWQVVSKVRGLAMTLDGKIFGMRNMRAPKESGYQLEGRVSVGGKKYRAFTSSTLFERDDGSLCDVATLVVSGFDKRRDHAQEAIEPNEAETRQAGRSEEQGRDETPPETGS